MSYSDGIVYYDFHEYLESCTGLQSKIDALEAIILSMMSALTKAAGTAQFQEYEFDDGQTKIKTMYRSPVELQKAIESMEFLKNKYIARLNNNGAGRMSRLVPGHNFIGPNKYGC